MYLQSLILIVTFVILQYLTEQVSGGFCLNSRLDVTPCINARITRPGHNQYGIYSTRIRPNSRGNPSCRIRKKGETIRKIPQFGSFKLLHSPGMELFPRINYLDQMLVDYHVNCESGQTALIGFLSMDLEPKNCYDPSLQAFRCQDYVQVDGGPLGTIEVCGNSPNSSLLIPSGNVRIRMRTSTKGQYPGFMAYVVCFRTPERNSGNILKTCRDVPDRSVAPNSAVGLKARQVGVTAGELEVVEKLASSLFNSAFINARNQHYRWPPREFFEEDELTPRPIDLNPIDRILPIEPILRPPIDRELERFDEPQHKRALQTALPSGLSQDIARTAVRFERACNPIVEAATNSYIKTFNKFEHRELEIIRAEFREPEELEFEPRELEQIRADNFRQELEY